MPDLHSLNITLSEDALRFMQDAVATGEFASASAVLQSGLDVLQSELKDRRRGEREIVVPAYYRLKANPSSALSIEQVEAGLQDRRNERARQRLQADVL